MAFPSTDITEAIQVSPLTDGDLGAWTAFADSRPEATFFHRIEWRRLMCDTLGFRDRYLIARRLGAVVGVLPMVEVRHLLFGSSFTSLPFCAYGGPLSIDADAQRALIDAAVAMARQHGVARVELRCLSPLDAASPRQSLYSTFRAPIAPGLDDLKGIPQKRRNVVRRAISLGLRADVRRDADRFFELYAENARAHGTPALARRFFHALLAAFPADCDVLFVTDAQGRDLSAILNFYHRGEVLAYFAGEVAAARETNANDFKYWSLMRHAVSRGCTQFDFGRSKADTGSFQFKRLWGFTPHQLHYEYPYLPSGAVPQNNPNNPKFQLAMRVWQRLPRAIVDRVGPPLAQGLG